MAKNKINKFFPANISLDKQKKTFLADSKVNAELYAYLLSRSVGEKGETRVYKDRLLSIGKISTEILMYKSKNTAQNHFKYLKEKEYLIDKGEYYIMPLTEKIFFQMPLDLVRFFVDTLKEPVIKTYIYLGQRNSYKPNQYVFTNKEICEHLGLNPKSSAQSVKNYLTILENCDLIRIKYFREGKVPKMRLVGFSTKVPESPNRTKK